MTADELKAWAEEVAELDGWRGADARPLAAAVLTLIARLDSPGTASSPIGEVLALLRQMIASTDAMERQEIEHELAELRRHVAAAQASILKSQDRIIELEAKLFLSNDRAIRTEKEKP